MSKTTLDLPNGDRATISPLDPLKYRMALKALAKRDIHVAGLEKDLLTTTEFSVALNKLIIVGYEVKQDDGSFKELNTNDLNELIDTRPRIVNYLVKRADAISKEQDKEFDEDLPNS